MTTWRTRGHRGDALEDTILLTNDYYRIHHYALIDKASTPIKVVDINDNGIITKGYFEKKSTVDFIGIVQGVAIAFDAKETNLNSLPLSNIHEHQLQYMKEFDYQGGLSFIIVHFKKYDDYFLLPLEHIDAYFKESKAKGRKSIPYESMIDSFKIKIESNGILNYLPILNKYMEYKKSSSD
ncbi:MAG: Holliday junction resolvase RecU [Clostridiales bacterium]|nr:Holliday junction resolvase RecU [Clostridiales bacterium]